MQIKNLFLFISLVSSISPIYSNNALLNLDNSDLDALAIHYGTDKGSEWHHEGVKKIKDTLTTMLVPMSIISPLSAMNQSNFWK